MTPRADLATVNAQLAERMADMASALTGTNPTSRARDELRFRRKGSLAVRVAGPRRGSWYDHEAGCGGNPLGLIAHLHRAPMRDAHRWALGWLGKPVGTDAPEPRHRPVEPSTGQHGRSSHAVDRRRQWSVDRGRTLWREACPAAGTAVEAYLASRALALPPDAPLRFHPQAWRNSELGPAGPAMIALMTVPETGEPCGAHVTYLRPDGRGKVEGDRSKVMLGSAGVIRLVPDEDVTLGLGIAEGIETALAVLQRARWAPVWAATSAGAVSRFPVLPGIECLTTFADTDAGGTGMDAARTCCRRWAEAGREARILAPPVGDWDDALARREEAA